METLKQAAVLVLLVVGWASAAQATENPAPFGFVAGQTTYDECLEKLKSHGWDYTEYTKKDFNLLNSESPERGRNTFLLVPKPSLPGINGIQLFFSGRQRLDAVIVNLEPKLFEIIMDELDRKYKLVKKQLEGESYSENHPRVLWEQAGTYIELQRLSPHHVRLIYVERVLYENYKDFWFKPYEAFRRRLARPDWVGDL